MLTVQSRMNIPAIGFKGEQSYIVRRDFGARIANQVARRLVVYPHREGGQAQFIERLKTKTARGFEASSNGHSGTSRKSCPSNAWPRRQE
jgi:hypothetical protein